MNSTTYEDTEGTRLTNTRSADLRGPLAGTATGSMTAPASHAFGLQGVDGGQPVQGPGVPPTAPDMRQGAQNADNGVTYGATGGPRSQECDAPTTPITRGPAQSRGTNSQRVQPRPHDESINNVPRNRRIRKPNKAVRDTMCIATLNMRGASGQNTERKWRDLNHRIKTDKIAVITLQETHLLSDEKIDRINNDTIGFRMKLSNSGDPTAPNSKGVSFVLNKSLTRYDEATVKEIEPGRALLLTLPWQGNSRLNILNVYAPNKKKENEKFWADLNKKWIDENLPIPDVMLGDFNIVEEAIDRVPAKPANHDALQALNEFKATIEVHDTWRLDHQHDEIFTWEQLPDRRHKSRLDRIYMNTHLREHCCEWRATWPEVQTDHKLVSVKIYNPGTPYIGRGRWTIPLHLMQDKEVKLVINQLSNKLIAELDKYNESESKTAQYIQILYGEWKATLTQKIRDIAKRKIPYIDKRLNEIQQLLHATQNNANLSAEDKVTKTAAMEDEAVMLTGKRYQKIRDNMDTNGWINRECIRKPWINENKENKPREIMTMLKVPGTNPPEYEKRTDRMLQIARTHHESLQGENLPESVEVHQEDMQPAIAGPETTLNTTEQEYMAQDISDNEVQAAIRNLPNGKAPGLDGIPHEFWKILLERYDTAEKAKLGTQAPQLRTNTRDAQNAPPNVTKILKLLYNDIEHAGIREGSKFADGWMCPIFKKKDRTDIANYRPITVLNADYKLMTRILAVRIAHVAPNLIHKSQAGFMKGRNIADLTDLTHHMISRCEMAEENGVIVFLDQEKAYDKILHPYLWEVMRSRKIPEKFIQLVKTLYNDAYTTVIINGVIGTPFKITRGVRQGDPMSCLLFNLAIEPLSQMLRTSTLKGFKIQGQNDQLITTLFADDTTVYLHEDDDFTALQTILQTWCRASGARFNVAKTEILPIGTEAYRAKVISTRQIKPTDEPIAENIRIVRDGEHTRTLGAYVGNGIEEINVWTPAIDAVGKALKRWARGKPTQEGLRLTANMEIGGRTQYLTRVQEMPKEIQKSLEKQQKKYMWDGKQSRIKVDTLCAPITRGGRKLLDMDSRNKAIALRRLQTWCKTGEDRPTWAWVADDIIARNIALYTDVQDYESVIHLGLQSLKPRTGSRTVTLPSMIKRMLLVKDEYKVIFDPPALTEKAKRDLPVWYHVAELHITSAASTARRLRASQPTQNTRNTNWNNLVDMQCLRQTHNASTVGDTLDLANRMPAISHKNRKDCKCTTCKDIRRTGCVTPHKCMTTAQMIIDALPPKFKPDNNPRDENQDHPSTQILDHDTIHFDKNTAINDAYHGFRVLGKKDLTAPDPTPSGEVTHDENTQIVTVYTDGSCENNGDKDACAGAGIWYGQNDMRNRSIKLPETMEQSNNTGELVAILGAVQDVDSDTTLVIKTDSQYAIDGIITYRQRMEDRGWINTENREIFKAIIGRMRARAGSTYLAKVKGHAGIEGNEGADKLAGIGAQRQYPDDIDLTVPEHCRIEGARLASLSQATLYKGIRENVMGKYKERQTTVVMLESIRSAVKARSNRLPTDGTMWKSIRNRDIDRKTRAFMYRAMHVSQRVGKYWEKIPQHEYKAHCRTCNKTESLEHIYMECANTGQQQVWNTALQVLRNRGINPGQKTLSNWLSSGMPNVKRPNGRADSARNRFYTIIMTESLYLIWLIRCEWRMEREEKGLPKHSPQEIESRWTYRINKRLRLDQAMAKRRPHEWRSLNKNLVLNTWRGSLTREAQLPEDWIGEKGVLVSTEDRRPPGRNR